MSRAGCFTRDWDAHLRLSKPVHRVTSESRVNLRALITLMHKHAKRLPTLLPTGRCVTSRLEWAGSSDALVATTICDARSGRPLTLVSFSWEGS